MPFIMLWCASMLRKMSTKQVGPPFCSQWVNSLLKFTVQLKSVKWMKLKAYFVNVMLLILYLVWFTNVKWVWLTVTESMTVIMITKWVAWLINLSLAITTVSVSVSKCDVTNLIDLALGHSLRLCVMWLSQRLWRNDWLCVWLWLTLTTRLLTLTVTGSETVTRMTQLQIEATSSSFTLGLYMGHI